MSQPLSYYPKYEPLTWDEFKGRVNGLLRIFGDYINHAGLSGHSLGCSRYSLYEIIERVNKRKVYFKVFHDKEMSERNEVSLYCFWILKLAPFFNATNPNITLNVNFAIYFLLKVTQYICMKSGQEIVFAEEYINSLRYAFTFRDISKESIMAIVETMLGTLTKEGVEGR